QAVQHTVIARRQFKPAQNALTLLCRPARWHASKSEHNNWHTGIPGIYIAYELKQCAGILTTKKDTQHFPTGLQCTNGALPASTVSQYGLFIQEIKNCTESFALIKIITDQQ